LHSSEYSEKSDRKIKAPGFRTVLVVKRVVGQVRKLEATNLHNNTPVFYSGKYSGSRQCWVPAQIRCTR
jgi:hypothetical protein